MESVHEHILVLLGTALVWWLAVFIDNSVEDSRSRKADNLKKKED